MQLKEKINKDINYLQLDNLFREIGWSPRGKDKWAEVLSKSFLVFSLWEGDKLVGFGRIIEDGVMCMFYDIGVLPPYQSKGLGTRIMNFLISHIKEKGYASIGLFAWEENPNNISFYKKFGFVRV